MALETPDWGLADWANRTEGWTHKHAFMRYWPPAFSLPWTPTCRCHHQLFPWPQHITNNKTQLCINTSEEHRKQQNAPTGVYREDLVLVERCIGGRWDENWTTLLARVAFSYFRCHWCPWCSTGPAGRLKEKDPSVVWDYFKPDSAEDVTCLEELRGGGIMGRREGGAWSMEVTFSIQHARPHSCIHAVWCDSVCLALCLLMWLQSVHRHSPRGRGSILSIITSSFIFNSLLHSFSYTFFNNLDLFCFYAVDPTQILKFVTENNNTFLTKSIVFIVAWN